MYHSVSKNGEFNEIYTKLSILNYEVQMRYKNIQKILYHKQSITKHVC